MIDFQEIMNYSKSNPTVFEALYEEVRNLNIIPYPGFPRESASRNL